MKEMIEVPIEYLELVVKMAEEMYEVHRNKIGHVPIHDEFRAVSALGTIIKMKDKVGR